MSNEDKESGILAVGDDLAASAGRLTAWETGGVILMDDLREAWEAAGLPPEDLVASPPTLTGALGRAAASVLRSKRHVQRPLATRGSWEIHLGRVDEKLADEGASLEHQPIIRGWVERVDGEERPCLKVLDAELGEEARDQILAALPAFRHSLRSDDVRSWLRRTVGRPLFDGVQLQFRGSFYFIPERNVEAWRKVQTLLKDVSAGACRIITLPAVRAEDMVDTVLRAVKLESEAVFAEAEASLALGGDAETPGISDRTIKRCEARVAAALEKCRRYEALLGEQLPNLAERSVQLQGMIVAARAQQVKEA